MLGMKVWSTIVLVLLLLLEGLAALAMLVLSVHGPSGIIIAAPVYFVVATTLTVWAARKSGSVPRVLGVGLLMLALAPGVVAALARIESWQYARRIAATRIADVRDEPILSSGGRAIGVRLSYSVTTPSHGYFGITPSLFGGDPKSERLAIFASRWTIDGHSEPVPFEPGKTHRMVVELYPRILTFKRDERCLSIGPLDSIPDGTRAMPLRVMISESAYGNTYHGGRDESTQGSYDVAEMYRGVLAEGLKPCA